MKKFIMLLVVMLVLVGCGGSTKYNSVEQIKENGELVLLTEAGFPPFEYASSAEGSVDNIAGVDIDFAKALADKLGVTLKIVDMDFDSLTTALAANKGDIIAAGLTVNEERSQVVDFSQVYFDNGLVILTASDSDINSVDDLVNKKISVQQGSTGNDFADELAKEHADIEVLTFKGMIEAGLAIKNGNVDAAIMDILPAQIIASQNNELKVVENMVENEEIAFAVGKGNESLLTLVNELIDELNATGQFEAWFSSHYDSLLEE